MGTSNKGPVWEFLLWKNIIRRDYFCNKCQRNIIFDKIDICVPLPPAYVREVWDYSKANAENIKKAICSFNWNKAFENLSTDAKVELLNETLLNIFRNYIPNKKVKCDYRHPPWMNDNIKRKLKERTKLIRYFDKNGQMKCDYDKILEKSAECNAEKFDTKKNYIFNMTSKLVDSHTAPKTYWTLLNRLLYDKKIPAIQPLPVAGKFVSDFYEKSNIFNNFFASVCTPIKNTSTSPSFSYRTKTRIKSFNLTEKIYYQ